MKTTASRYLVRFDDICPTMNWAVWEVIEALLDEYRVCPILAVVPDNRDQELKVNAAHPDFWKQVRAWQQKGWTIGVHGYQHLYVAQESGILGLNQRSEFAGLTYDNQLSKLRSAIEFFEREDVSPQVWVAPSHSFDWNTVRALKDTGLGVISDGLSRFPHRDKAGLLWIPQQLWRFRAVPNGVWTVCFHHNGWRSAQLRHFQSDIQMYANRLSSVSEVSRLYAHRKRTASDRIHAAAMYGYIRATGYCDRFLHGHRRRDSV